MFLCIDQGGQASRAIVYSPTGQPLAEATRPIATHRAAGFKVEHDAGAVLRSVTEAIAAVTGTDGVPPTEINAAGLATQRSSLVCVHRVTGEPLTPVISWQDRRAAGWLNQFTTAAGKVKRRTGLPLSPHYGASKIAWCLDNVPAVRQAADQSQLIAAPLASFLLHGLLSEAPWVVDPANASRTLLMSSRTLAWDPYLLELFRIPLGALPGIVATRYRFGHLGAQQIPLSVCNGDQAAAIFAWGEPALGTAFVNIGTGAFIQAVAGTTPVDDPALLSSIAFSGGERRVYVLEGTVNGAASAVQVVGAELGVAEQERLANAERWLAEADTGVLYLNGIGGLGSPDWVADFPSRFIGGGTPPARLVAVYESIVFLILRNLERMQSRLEITAIVVSGGLSALDGICQRLANLSGLQVERPADQEATALGIAYLLGSRRSRRASTTTFLPVPDPALHARYRRWSELLESALAARV